MLLVGQNVFINTKHGYSYVDTNFSSNLHCYSEMFSAFTTSNVLAIRKASLLLNIFQMFSSPDAFLKDGTKRVYYCSEMVWY